MPKCYGNIIRYFPTSSVIMTLNGITYIIMLIDACSVIHCGEFNNWLKIVAIITW